ncbi:MAG: type IV toxin-antitoxin system AbiEi family antitoxin [Oscillospiraceae bacterium]|nr:type IV toxin-antitoxin system AbiEi family antitoxin [Oscillospiraceae bacterium]
MNNNVERQLKNAGQIKASESVDWMLAHGVSSITTNDLAALLGIPKNHVPQRMAALKQRNQIVTPARGLWVPVPPEYMTWGAPPAIEIIDAIMSHLETDYYIGWLSAADLHGASHHAPQVFQVATSRAIRSKTAGRSHFQFYHRERIRKVLLIQKETKSGIVYVSSKETTLLDICNDVGIIGGLDNAANLIMELCDTSYTDMNSLVALTEYYPVTAARRLGFLLEYFTEVTDLDYLKAVCEKQNTSPSILDPQGLPIGILDASWCIKVNREVLPDV